MPENSRPRTPEPEATDEAAYEHFRPVFEKLWEARRAFDASESAGDVSEVTRTKRLWASKKTLLEKAKAQDEKRYGQAVRYLLAHGATENLGYPSLVTGDGKAIDLSKKVSARLRSSSRAQPSAPGETAPSKEAVQTSTTTPPPPLAKDLPAAPPPDDQDVVVVDKPSRQGKPKSQPDPALPVRPARADESDVDDEEEVEEEDDEVDYTDPGQRPSCDFASFRYETDIVIVLNALQQYMLVALAAFRLIDKFKESMGSLVEKANTTIGEWQEEHSKVTKENERLTAQLQSAESSARVARSSTKAAEITSQKAIDHSRTLETELEKTNGKLRDTEEKLQAANKRVLRLESSLQKAKSGREVAAPLQLVSFPKPDSVTRPASPTKSGGPGTNDEDFEARVNARASELTESLQVRAETAEAELRRQALKKLARFAQLKDKDLTMHPTEELLSYLSKHDAFTHISKYIERVIKGQRSNLRDAEFVLHLLCLSGCPSGNAGFLRFLRDKTALDGHMSEPLKNRNNAIRNPGAQFQVYAEALESLLEALTEDTKIVIGKPKRGYHEAEVLVELVIIYALTVKETAWNVSNLRFIIMGGIGLFGDLTTEAVIEGTARAEAAHEDYVSKILRQSSDRRLPGHELLVGNTFSSQEVFREKMDTITAAAAQAQAANNTPAAAQPDGATPGGGQREEGQRSAKSGRGRTTKVGGSAPSGRSGPLRVSHFFVHSSAPVRRLVAELDPSDDIMKLAAGRCYVCGNKGHVFDDCPIKEQRDRWIPTARELGGRERALVGALVAKGKLEAVKL